jgi:hypothetical protein
MGQQTWFSGVREAFLSGDHEPWVFRGKVQHIFFVQVDLTLSECPNTRLFKIIKMQQFNKERLSLIADDIRRVC